MSAASSTPAIVAIATLRSGFSTTAAATEALSSPRYAQNTSTSDCFTRLEIRRAAHVPVRAELRGIEHEPADRADQQQAAPGPRSTAAPLNRPAKRGLTMFTAVASHISAMVMNAITAGLTSSAEESGEIPRRCRGDGDVADEARRPVPEACLHAGKRPERIEDVGGRSARHRLASRELAEQQCQRDRANGGRRPSR